jgi:hypothetical protein
VVEAFFRETTTFGARMTWWDRATLDREIVEAEGPYGIFHVKVGRFRGRVVSAAPEYEDARRIAAEAGEAFRTVYSRLAAAADAFLAKPGGGAKP